MSSVIPSFKPLAGFSWGRWLGSWVGVAMTPLFPMLNWIFAPYFSLEKILAYGAKVETLVQYQAALTQLGSGILLGRILPSLLLCLALCILFSVGFARLGGWIEQRIREILFKKNYSGSIL